MKRGDIFYIQYRNTIGAEIAKGRPAVIVSANALNATSEVVEVVYLTTQPKKNLPTHVTISSSGTPSTVCCEQIDSVSKLLVGDYFGACTSAELNAIDAALLVSLGITVPKEHEVALPEPEKPFGILAEAENKALRTELDDLRAKCARYVKIIDRLLEAK